MSTPCSAKIRIWSSPRCVGACACVQTGAPVRALTRATAVTSRSTSGVSPCSSVTALTTAARIPVSAMPEVRSFSNIDSSTRSSPSSSLPGPRKPNGNGRLSYV